MKQSMNSCSDQCTASAKKHATQRGLTDHAAGDQPANWSEQKPETVHCTALKRRPGANFRCIETSGPSGIEKSQFVERQPTFEGLRNGRQLAYFLGQLQHFRRRQRAARTYGHPFQFRLPVRDLRHAACIIGQNLAF